MRYYSIFILLGFSATAFGNFANYGITNDPFSFQCSRIVNNVVTKYDLVAGWAWSDPLASDKLDEWLSESEEENEDVPSGTLMRNRKWLMEQGLPYSDSRALCNYFRHSNINNVIRQFWDNKTLDQLIIREVIYRTVDSHAMGIARFNK